MKKHVSLFAAVAAVLAVPAFAATNVGTRAGSSADLTGAPATRERVTVDYDKYQTRTTTRTYETADAGTMYYTQPANRSAMYKQYDNGRNGVTTTTVRTTRSEVVRNEMKRKYYLAHPFYQPTQGKVGSITDFSYNMNSYDFALSPLSTLTIDGTEGKWKANGFSIKEDLSYGITDRIAIMGMLRYDMNKYKFDWDSPDIPDDSMNDNDLTLIGLGGQWRFVDNADWIATASAYFQHQKDVANYFVLDLKGGYKIARSTIYGLLRGWYVDIDGETYGNGITSVNSSDVLSTMYLAYSTDTKNTFYVEGGLGVFSVLDEDWTLNLEAIFGDYDWHNQFSIKGAIGWQPNDWFALNLYAKMALFDSADDKDLTLYWQQAGLPGYEQGLTYAGTAKIDNYSETTVGLQVIFQF